MPNPYHDAEGRFCSRNEMKAAIDHAYEARDMDTYIRLREDMAAADQTDILDFFLNSPATEPEPDRTNEDEFIQTSLNTSSPWMDSGWDEKLQRTWESYADNSRPVPSELIQLVLRKGDDRNITSALKKLILQVEQLRTAASNPRVNTETLARIFKKTAQISMKEVPATWEAAMAVRDVPEYLKTWETNTTVLVYEGYAPSRLWEASAEIRKTRSNGTASWNQYGELQYALADIYSYRRDRARLLNLKRTRSSRHITAEEIDERIRNADILIRLKEKQDRYFEYIRELSEPQVTSH